MIASQKSLLFIVRKRLLILKITRLIKPLFGPLMLILWLSGCGVNQLAHVGETPKLTQIENPLDRKSHTTVSMPMPEPKIFIPQDNSLWQPGSRGFFKDLRANEVGDIVTVLVDVQDSATLNNETQQRRESSTDADIGALAGFDSTLSKILPGEPSLNNLFDTDSDTSHNGTGSISRDERIQLRVAAIVTQNLPNGNMVIYGRQEMRVNLEVRELHVAGIIRPEDIDSNNQITYEKIAEARVAYGGRGQLTNVQQPRYGSQIADILLPF